MKPRYGVIFAVFGSFLLTLLLNIVIFSPLNAQSTLAQQKQCAEGAKKFFLNIFKPTVVSEEFFSDKKGGVD